MPKDALGLDLAFAAEPPGFTAVFRPRPEHEGPEGYLHGGIAALCLDETMARLGYALDGVHTVTAKLELKYRNPVPLDGEAVRVEAWRENPESRRVQQVKGRLLLADGRVAVEARGLFAQVS